MVFENTGETPMLPRKTTGETPMLLGKTTGETPVPQFHQGLLRVESYHESE